jgi:hypothetical protein
MKFVNVRKNKREELKSNRVEHRIAEEQKEEGEGKRFKIYKIPFKH